MASKNAPPRRPSITTLEVPFDFDELAAIDSYIAEIDIGMSRPDAIREILRKALAAAPPKMAKIGLVDQHTEKVRFPKANADELESDCRQCESAKELGLSERNPDALPTQLKTGLPSDGHRLSQRE